MQKVETRHIAVCRSHGVNILQTSSTVLNFSKRAFCHASPLVWNNLPQSVISHLTVTTNTFKNRLKCALYSRAFLQWHVTLPHLRFFTYCEWQNVCLNHVIIIIIIIRHSSYTVVFNVFQYLQYDCECDYMQLCATYSCRQFDSLSRLRVRVEGHFDDICVVTGERVLAYDHCFCTFIF